MMKSELQAVFNVEQAVLSAHERRYRDGEISLTQFSSLQWHSEQRLEALHNAASNAGWLLER